MNALWRKQNLLWDGHDCSRGRCFKKILNIISLFTVITIRIDRMHTLMLDVNCFEERGVEKARPFVSSFPGLLRLSARACTLIPCDFHVRTRPINTYFTGRFRRDPNKREGYVLFRFFFFL